MTLTRVIGSRGKEENLMLPCIISQDIVKYLHEVKGFSLEEIADITSMPVQDVKNILKGSRTFSVKNIKSLKRYHKDKTVWQMLLYSWRTG